MHLEAFICDLCPEESAKEVSRQPSREMCPRGWAVIELCVNDSGFSDLRFHVCDDCLRDPKQIGELSKRVVRSEISTLTLPSAVAHVNRADAAKGEQERIAKKRRR